MSTDYQKFSAQYELYDEITPDRSEDKKKKKTTLIYNVLYKQTNTTRILKKCENRDLSTVCEVLKKIRNANVAVIYDYVYYDGDTYILEEKLQGETLEEKLKKEDKLSPKETVRIISKVCDGLSELHEMNPPVIHNDIKPSNIFICDDGNVKVFDFDISRTYKEDSDQNTDLMGTEDYASPEHYGFGGQTDQRSDVYSLGVTMHKMLSGKVLNKSRKPTYTGTLSEIINKCVQKEPDERYGSVKELKNALEGRDAPKKGKFGWIFFAVIVCAVLAVGIGFFVKSGMNKNETEPSVQDSVGSEIFTDNNGISTTEKINETNNTTTQPAQNNTKAVKVVSKATGVIASMVSLNDGTIVYLENDVNECRIKTSTGVDKVVYIPSDVYDLPVFRSALLYNTYTDKLYLVYQNGMVSESELYLIDENYNIGHEPLYAAKSGWGSDAFCGFFLSDGTLYCNAFSGELVDSVQWIEIGSASFSATTQFNDRMFYINPNTFAEELGHGAETVYYDVPWSYLLDAKYCTTKDGIYFLAKADGKDCIYKFDGNTFTKLMCLEDYKYYTHSIYEKFVVTNDKVWLYDNSANTIKELPIK